MLVQASGGMALRARKFNGYVSVCISLAIQRRVAAASVYLYLFSTHRLLSVIIGCCRMMTAWGVYRRRRRRRKRSR